MKMGRTSERGDQYVTVQIQVPTNLSREAQRKLREFEQACKNRETAASEEEAQRDDGSCL